MRLTFREYLKEQFWTDQVKKDPNQDQQADPKTDSLYKTGTASAIVTYLRKTKPNDYEGAAATVSSYISRADKEHNPGRKNIFMQARELLKRAYNIRDDNDNNKTGMGYNTQTTNR